jgi:riboflavin synthase
LADASAETLERTTLGALRVGHAANLERAMPLGGRMGGHIVTGHVDGTVALYARKPLGDAVQLVFEFPREWARLIAVKGSICINGVSLTVNGIEGGRFDVVVVPHTREATSLDRLVVGHRVNIEVDVLARYVARMIDAASEGGVSAKEHEARDATLLGHLKKSGYV